MTSPTLHSDLVITPEFLTKVSKLNPKQRRAVMKVIGELEWKRCAEDPLYWVDTARHPGVPYVYTNERHKMVACILCKDHMPHPFNRCEDHLKAFHDIKAKGYEEIKAYFSELPGTRPFTVMPYMPPIIDAWLRHQFLFVPKSRDMVATWLVMMLYTWDTVFHSNRQNIVQSEDTSKTYELIERADFMYQHQPRWLKSVKPAVFTMGSVRAGVLKVKDLYSEMLGFPSGADQIRQYHPTGVFTDETAFQVEAGESFAAIKPAVQAGGRYTAVSSAYPSWFWLAVEDRTDEAL